MVNAQADARATGEDQVNRATDYAVEQRNLPQAGISSGYHQNRLGVPG